MYRGQARSYLEQRKQPPTKPGHTLDIMWEPVCWRRGAYIPSICMCLKNVSRASALLLGAAKAAFHKARAHIESHVGASLLAKRPVHPKHMHGPEECIAGKRAPTWRSESSLPQSQGTPWTLCGSQLAGEEAGTSKHMHGPEECIRGRAPTWRSESSPPQSHGTH